MSYKRLWKVIPDDGSVCHTKAAKWKLGKWRKAKGEIKLCKNGYHASPRILDALGYVPAGIICLVEVRGMSISEGDKSVHAEMRIVKAYKIPDKEWRIFACRVARDVLPIFDAVYPANKRPLLAIEAADAYANNPTDENKRKMDATMDAAGDAAMATTMDAARDKYNKWLRELCNKNTEVTL